MNHWFTSDQHFGHNNVIGLCDRPFEDIDHMHDEMIVRWNSVVKPQDTVWVVGDYSLHPRELTHLKHMRGTKRLIAGNHDVVWSGHKESHKYFRTYLEYFESIHEWKRLKFSGFEFNLSHFPYGTGRYESYRLKNVGVPLVHGHVHEKWKLVNTKYVSWNDTPMLNVGVDRWNFTPVSLEEVIHQLREGIPEPHDLADGN